LQFSKKHVIDPTLLDCKLCIGHHMMHFKTFLASCDMIRYMRIMLIPGPFLRINCKLKIFTQSRFAFYLKTTLWLWLVSLFWKVLKQYIITFIL